jgi:peroxiredoxin
MRTSNFITMLGVVCLTAGLAYAGCGSCGGGHDHKHDTDKSGHVAKVGHAAPMFTLTDHEGKTVELASFFDDDAGESHIVVLEWFNPDCPYVKRHYENKQTMNELASKYKGKDVVWLAVNSSHYADRAFNHKWAEKWQLDHRVLNDPRGEVGRTYQARTTPHMFIINKDRTLVYDGAIDNDPRSNKPDAKTVNYVDQALTQLLNGDRVEVRQTKPYGCSVKYAPKQAEAADATADDQALAGGSCGSCKPKGDDEDEEQAA